MAKKQIRLLERIRMHDPMYHQKRIDDAQKHIDSVKGYIQHILNTRQGSAILDEGIGIPDFNSMNLNFSVNSRYELEMKIRSVIEKFEPRIGKVKVTLEGVSDPTEGLRFKIEGLIGDDNPLHVDFDTVVNGEGKIYLRNNQA